MRCRSLRRDGSLAKQPTPFPNGPGLPTGPVHFEPGVSRVEVRLDPGQEGRRFSDTLRARGEQDMTNESEPRANVLVLEDDPAVGPLIVRLLESAGYTATLASDRDAARAALRGAH